MARKKKQVRKEPVFGALSSLAELRVSLQDRILGPEQDKPRVNRPRTKAKEASSRPSARGGGRRKPGGFRKRLARGAYWSAVAGLWAVIAAVGAVVWVGAHLPPIQSLEVPKRPPSIQIVGLDGSVLAVRGEMAGDNVALKSLPPYLPQAFIAIEDRRFHSHFGVDPLGIARAALANILHRGVSQGGSTLTQQLAKNLFLTQERTLQRKLQEVELAFWLEHKYSKNEILELYLNRVYFGSGAYGVDAAAQRYFGKPAKAVTLAEAAMLAGLVRSPSRLAPNRNPDGAAGRARVVLAAMADAGFITTAQASAASRNPSYAMRPPSAGTINYVADWIGEVLDDLVGQVEQNIVVETTIDPKLQNEAEAAVIDTLAANSGKFNVSQGALVAMTPDGAVRAMVGGRNYADSQFNRAVTAKRQPGSAFKPFVYLTAVEQGLTPDTVRQDAPVNIRGWKPENYGHDYLGAVTLTQALAQSLNTVAVRLGVEVGPQSVVRTAHRLGIASKLEANASIALGTSEVSLLELTGAYAPFANGGRGVAPYVIARIRTPGGRLLYARKAAAPAQVIDPQSVAMMNAMMAETLRSGTARKAELPGWPAAGKTGTSQDFRDAWFVGYTARLVTGVWFGNDDNAPMKKATGSGLPLEVWTRVMRAAHQGAAVAALPGGAGEAVSRPVAAAGERATVTRAAARPEADSGLDGWLMQRLFGR